MIAAPRPEATSPILACLRVALPRARGSGTAALDLLVAKLVSAFLESRWSWPRHFEQATPYSFLLSDPRTTQIDLGELKHLALELQSKLFGVDGAGEVDLLVFEGDEVQLHRFARLDPEAVHQLLAGEGDEDISGSLSRIGPSGVVRTEVADGAAAEAQAAPAEAIPDPLKRRYEAAFRGTYFVAKQVFTSSMTYVKPFGSTKARALLDRGDIMPGVPAEEYDETSLAFAVQAVADHPRCGMVMTPMSFSTLVRRGGRTNYAGFLGAPDPKRRERLAVAVYDTPRSPSFSALSQIVGFLAPHFGKIALHVNDPAFSVEILPPGIYCVAFTIPDGDAPTRLSAIRRFSEHLPEFTRKRIWPVVDGLKTRTEVDACIARRVPLVSGPAVSDLCNAPLGGQQHALSALPLRQF